MSEQENELSRIERKLDIIVRLLAMRVTADGNSLVERATRLEQAGLSSREISEVLQTTRNAVSVALSNARKKPSSGLAKRRKPSER